MAIAIYCQWWFPNTPKWLWILAFSVALVYVNARSVGNFGSFEYWFAMIKVVAIVLFVVCGLALVLGFTPKPAIGFSNFTAHGGFLPTGWRGVWMAMVFVIFSYLGTEVVAVTAGEAKDPQTAVPRAMRSMVGRLILFYLGSITVLIAIVPWNQIQPGSDVTASPFVKVFQLIGVPAAAHIVNFVVITAAASSMNCNLYLCGRMIFSLARGGYAPAAFGVVSRRNTPIAALLVSAAGLAVAIVVALVYPEQRVCLFVWSLPLRRIIRVAGDLRHSLSVSQEMGCIRRPPFARAHDRISVHVDSGNRGDRRDSATTWWVEGMRVTLISGNSVARGAHHRILHHRHPPQTSKLMSLLSQFSQALTSGAIRVIDLTQPLDASTAIIPLPPEFGQCWPFRLEEISRYDQRGPAWYWNNFSCGEHTGTHFDAPVHWVTGKDYPQQRDRLYSGREILRPGLRDRRVARCRRKSRLPDDSGAHRTVGTATRPRAGRIMGADAYRLVQTQDRGGVLNIKEDGSHAPGPHPDLVPFLARERDVIGWGSEGVGTDAGQAFRFDPPFPCHSIMHGNNKFGLASLTNLDQLPPTGAILITPPLKIVNGSGSPCRVLALVSKP